MPVRTTETEISFRQPFFLRAVGEPLPAGTYRLIYDEEELDGLSFEAWRRIATMLITPAIGIDDGSEQVFTIDPHELDAALKADQSR